MHATATTKVGWNSSALCSSDNKLLPTLFIRIDILQSTHKNVIEIMIVWYRMSGTGRQLNSDIALLLSLCMLRD